MTFIAFEGLDASGKTTQARRFAERISPRALLTREPGDTALGARIRELLLDTHWTVAPEAEALLMAADRAQHVAEVVRPALLEGRTVITDRYLASSVAYQGYGRRLDVAMVRSISAWATRGLYPDITVFLRIPVEVALARLAATGNRLDRLEAEGAELLIRVAAGYEALVTSEPGRWIDIDGTGTPHEVAEAIEFAVEPLLE
jgi:dTMP kinase